MRVTKHPKASISPEDWGPELRRGMGGEPLPVRPVTVGLGNVISSPAEPRPQTLFVQFHSRKTHSVTTIIFQYYFEPYKREKLTENVSS